MKKKLVLTLITTMIVSTSLICCIGDSMESVIGKFLNNGNRNLKHPYNADNDYTVMYIYKDEENHKEGVILYE